MSEGQKSNFLHNYFSSVYNNRAKIKIRLRHLRLAQVPQATHTKLVELVETSMSKLTRRPFKTKMFITFQTKVVAKGYMYILECADKSYYTGSTKYLVLRLMQHQNGEGANHTKKSLPVKLAYFEEFDRIDHAFYRSRRKKEALINGQLEMLPLLSKSKKQ
jgi:putative endonuclease